MIAFVISIMIVVAVVQVSFGAQYWIESSQTSSEGLYRAKSKIEDLRAAARQSFYLASSSPFTRDTTDAICNGGGLCYYVTGTVSDLSPCSKLAHAQVDWKVEGYPTTTSSLYTNITSPNEIVSLGGDCILNQPSGAWASVSEYATAGSIGIPMGVDALSEVAYITTDTAPFIRIASESSPNVWSFVTDANNFTNYEQINDIDVARDESTGRIYAYVARNDPGRQFGVIDVTDPTHIGTSTMPIALNGVGGLYPQGWRIKYYHSRLYITTRFSAGNELHIINVSDPSNPVEVGSGIQLSRTVDDFVVRDQYANGATHRFVYLASEAGTKEVAVLDVTNDVLTNPQINIDLAGGVDAMSIFASGNKLFVGRAFNAGGGELYVFDISDPLASGFTTQTPQIREVGAGVTDIRVSGDFVYLRVTQGNKFRVWDSDPANLTEISSYNLPVVEQGIDLDGDNVYAVTASGAPFHVIHSQ